MTKEIKLEKNKKHTISVVIDRLKIRQENYLRINESLETALKLSKGKVVVQHNQQDYLFNTTFSCAECGFSFDEISPRIFSFNTPFGACKTCGDHWI